MGGQNRLSANSQSRGSSQDQDQGDKGRSRKAKVKSGCKTCKIRKVKCDEDWPACRRCLDTGRKCDGYGIWGGGSNATASNPPNRSCVSPSEPLSMPSALTRNPSSSSDLTSVLSDEEHYYFEWFMFRTAPKLPGAFVSPSATALMYQAISHEPAVLHAVLALSCVHQVELRSQEYGRLKADERQDRFILDQYDKAIKGLQRRLAIGDYKSTRLTLAACLVFVFLEFLRGHYQSGLKHLHCGLNLLQQMLRVRGSGQSFIDIGITGSILRLYVQAKLLGQETIRINPALLAAQHDATTTVFDSPYQARRMLEHLYLHIFELRERSKECVLQTAEHQSHLQTYQHYLWQRLKSWHTVYKASILPITSSTPHDLFAYQLLQLYHTLAETITVTAIAPNQMMFDHQTQYFVNILSQCIHIYRILYSDNFYTTFYTKTAPRESHSISDIGWIPPLYYTALKCRVHRIRLQAIRLIELSIHREGMWDATLVSVITKKVMQIEEQDLDGVFEAEDGFDVLNVPRPGDLLGPTPSEDRRLFDVSVVLPKNENDKLGLTCWKQHPTGRFEVFKGQYALETNTWIDSNISGMTPALPLPTRSHSPASTEVIGDVVNEVLDDVVYETVSKTDQLPAWSFGATNPLDLFGFIVKPTRT